MPTPDSTGHSLTQQIDLEFKIRELQKQLDELRPRPWLQLLSPLLLGGILTFAATFVQHRHEKAMQEQAEQLAEREMERAEAAARFALAQAREQDYLDRQQAMIEIVVGAEDMTTLSRAYAMFVVSHAPTEYEKQWKLLVEQASHEMTNMAALADEPATTLLAANAVERASVVLEASNPELAKTTSDSFATPEVQSLQQLDRAQTEAWNAHVKGTSKSRDEYAKALPALEAACQAEIPQACGRLGRLYQQGWGLDENLDRAKQLFERACKGGNAHYCEALKDLQI